MNVPSRLTDSPWFWVYLFGAAALIAMFLIGQKADTVQAQRDGNFTRRQLSLERQAALNRRVSEPEALPSEDSALLAEKRYVDFTPFYALFGIVTVVAWVMLWRQRLVRRTSPPSTGQTPA